MHDLQEMLTYRRPHRSRSERRFLNKFVRPVVERSDGWEDGFGNLICEVGSDLRMMYACHTDTVDFRSGRKRVHETSEGFFVTDSTEDCLGADDTTGVWMMLNLIEQGVEGLYVFHRAEEIGCLGSRWIVDNTPHLVEPVEWCLSLDRAGYGSIITHQSGRRTASDAFSRSLAVALDLGYHNDPNGIYTDSMEYAGLIPECTNISVGYDNCHTNRETQNYGYALAVLRALLDVDYNALTTARVPRAEPEYTSVYSEHSHAKSTDHWNGDDRYLADREFFESGQPFSTDDGTLLGRLDAWDLEHVETYTDIRKLRRDKPLFSDVDWGDDG